ncbi:MAG: efflux transporter outer membrane subunit [Methylococcales bacterium]|nr:efflux transporter outer membrane subunit [Methylococcales bacterium]
MRLFTFLLIFVFIFFNNACTVEVKKVPLPIELPQKFSRSGHKPLPQKWWEVFNDSQLNFLIEQALSDNFSLKSAFNRVEQARALAKKSGASLTPTLNAQFKPSGKITDKLSTQNFSLGLVASYEVDLWGRIRANLHASELDFRTVEEDLHTATLTLSAEIATRWYHLIEQRQQLKLLKQQIQTNTEQYQLLIIRFKASQATAPDVLQQQQLLESVKGSKASILASVRVLEYQLSVLLGKMPTTFKLPIAAQFPTLPELPKTGLPLTLAQRRPDVRKAYFKVQAADQRIAAAIADRFPKISLSAGIDTSAPNLQSLFNNWLATLAGNLILPIIDGHRRLAEVERTQAIAKAALNEYAHQLLNAVEEIESALIQQQQQQKLVKSLERQRLLSQQANEQIKRRYINGAESFLRILSSSLSQQNLARSKLQAQRQLIEYHIALYRALSGNFTGINP